MDAKEADAMFLALIRLYQCPTDLEESNTQPLLQNAIVSAQIVVALRYRSRQFCPIDTHAMAK